jgi:hypothetical protein
MHIFDRGILFGIAAIVCAASTAEASGTCARQRMPPHQNLFWVCVTPGLTCSDGVCQTLSYAGFIPYSTCECLPAASDSDDLSYGTGGFWTTEVTSGVPGPGATVTFQVASGFGELVVYPNVDVDTATGAIQNAQEYTSDGDFTGSLTVQIAAGAPTDSLAAHMTALSMATVSWSFEGEPTGTTTIALAPDGGAATGFWHAESGTLQFDAPVHCTASNALLGSFDFWFRPILIEAADAKAAVRAGTNPFSLFTTGRFEPQVPVPVASQDWGRVKALFR